MMSTTRLTASASNCLIRRPSPLLLSLSRYASTSSATTKFPEPIRSRYKRDAVIPRDLPKIKSRAPLYIAIAIASALSWGSFLYYATHNERANSSIVRSLIFQLKNSPEVKELLGEGTRLVPLFAGFRKVDGSINMLAGSIDLQFRLTGSKAKGTASFRSVRRGKADKFEVLIWRIVRDDGQILDLSGVDPRRVNGSGA